MSATVTGARTVRLAIDDPSGVGEARRVVTGLATEADLDAQVVAKASLVATELASNLVKHAKAGELLMRTLGPRGGRARGIELLSVDVGPGMEVARAMRDGFSTAGSRGVGMGAIERASTVFDAFSSPAGTTIVARIGDVADVDAGVGALAVPHPAETVCGDGWLVARRPGRTLVTVVDGLGHGPAAAEATSRMLSVVAAERDRSPREILEISHAALKSTRGAAASIAEIDHAARRVLYAGVGNVSGDILGADARTQSCVSVHGIVGAQLRTPREMEYALPPGALLVLCSDGIASSFRLAAPGLVARHPALVAGAIYRQHRRGRDDATVLVVREEASV